MAVVLAFILGGLFLIALGWRFAGDMPSIYDEPRRMEPQRWRWSEGPRRRPFDYERDG